MSKIVSIKDGKPSTTSILVAQTFHKQHGHVMRAIKNMDCSEEFRRSNFGKSEYLNAQQHRQPCYNITRDGFVFLAMGFTGRIAAEWKEKYINAFNEMEEYIRQQKCEEERQKSLPFETVLSKKFLAYFGADRKLAMTEIREGSYIITEDEFASVIREPGSQMKTDTIIKILSACTEVITRRAKSMN